MAKEWYYKTITEKDKKLCKEFLRIFRVGCRFTKYSSYMNNENHISIATQEFDGKLVSVYIFWSTVFHEFTHTICAREKIFETYHCKFTEKTPKNNRTIRRHALRAELYVDKKAEKLMKIFFPDLPYDRSYRTKADRDCLRQYMEKEHPLS